MTEELTLEEHRIVVHANCMWKELDRKEKERIWRQEYKFRPGTPMYEELLNSWWRTLEDKKKIEYFDIMRSII